ncbi:MAG: beta-lactamase family protein [Xanthomonadales bacterium]|nr:D-aminopeptidase [Xanthomonadales bacterium]MCC6592071.1 beta-lactamase family protein [Xanthomonadales bacterium]
MRRIWLPWIAVLLTFASSPLVAQDVARVEGVQTPLVAQPTAAGALAPQAPGAATDAVAGVDPADASLALAARIEAWTDAVAGYAIAAERVGGISVAIVQGGELLLIKGYGLAGVDPERPVTPRTLFRVGSISKTVTYLAAMQLVEHGRLDLDAPVNDYLPDALRIPDDGWREPVRVRHLLNHTAGFEDSFAGHLFYVDPERALRLPDWLVRDRPRRVRAPESAAVYSNYSVALLGQIVAEVSGASFEDYVEARILRPLGMATATFREPYDAALAQRRGLPAPPPPEVVAEIADGLRWSEGLYQRAQYEKVSHGAPAGGMVASALDMAAWMQALLDPARLQAARVLEPATRERMFAVSFRNAPGIAAIRHGFIESPQPGHAQAFGHGGSTLRFMADMLLLPELGLGIYIGTNSASGARLRGRFARLLLAEFFPTVASPSPVPADAIEQAAQVAGSYLVDRRPHARSERLLGLLGGVLSVRDAGDGAILVASALDGEATRLEAVGELGFRHPESGALWRFERGVDGMRLHAASGVSGGLRVTGLADPRWWMLLLALAGVAALLGLRGAWRRVWSIAPSTPSERTLGAWMLFAALAWVGAWALLLKALLRFLVDESEQALWAYPGWDYAGACWGFVVAGSLSVLALVAALRAWSRPRRWSFGSHFGFALQLLVYLAAVLAAWGLGVFGYSGFG